MSTINASIVDQVLTITNAPLIASGDINVDHVQFEFDQTWDDFGLMAVFWRDGDEASYRSVIGPTGLALVPHEVLTEEGRISFGVVGVAGDQTKTSSVGFYDIKQGALTTGSETDPPTPGEYEQMLTAVGEARAAFAAAVAQMEMAAGRVEIYDGLASDLSAVSRSAGTFRRVPFPTDMKIVDFDRMTIQLTNVGRPDLSAGQTGDLSIVTGDYTVLASFVAGNEGGITMLELSGLSGTPDDNAFQLTIANRYKTGAGSHSSEESIAIQSWGVTGILTNVSYIDLHVTGDTYVRVVGYCNEVAAEAPSGAYVKPAGGIPKSDLAAAVKASLGLADDSVQKSVQAAKTDEMTQPVGLGDDGRFYAKPGGSGGDVKPAGGWGTNDIANGAVTEAKIGSEAVTNNKIADGAVTGAKLSSDIQTALTAAGTAVQPSALAAYIPKAAQANADAFPAAFCAMPAGLDSNGRIRTPVSLTGAVTRTGTEGHYAYSANIGALVVYPLLQAYPHMALKLVDHLGRECTLINPPASDQESLVFFTLDKTAGKVVFYTVGTSGAVTIDQVSIGGGGGGSTTLPQLGGGYAADSVSGSTVARSVTISGFVRTVGNGPTVKFSNEISAKAPTLNINDGTDDTGAAAIWYCGSTLKPGTIRSGALVKFVFDGTHYCVESIDERPVIQLVPNNGVVSISGTYQDLIAKLKGAAVPQIICLSPNASAQNMEILELRHVWSNDTTSEIKLAGRLGGIEYYVVLSQSGSSGSEVMSGTLESANITPDVIMQNSLQPTIAIHNNELHDCGTVTRIYISSWPANGDWGLEFSSSSPATELVWAGNHPTWPDGMTSFVPETGKHYELNVHNGKALIGVWPV